jgi:hypothetical protein
MIERQIVGAAIRIFGLWRIFMTGLSSLIYWVAGHFQTSSDFSQITVAAQKEALPNVIFNIVVGIAVIFAAPSIARTIYREPPSPQS